ncbi:MAG TPA: hypothetical protein G4N92_06045 [Anaerolineae bacterium]|nr:hypothetical protein [Anaerolineae bacterium]
MIDKNTVFIFGAGVSKPYGYPTGIELLRGIRDNTASGYFNQVLHNYGFPQELLKKFSNDLSECQLPSIDIFLENRPKYIDLGKICICAYLLKTENKGRLLNDKSQEEGIYQNLYTSLIDEGGWKSFGENNVSFITFNYDRSLEYYLYTALKATSGESDKIIFDLISNIHIIHVYGSLPTGDNLIIPHLSYGFFSNLINLENNKELIIEISKEIEIFSEGEDYSNEFNEANILLKNAERIYFLGFGYHEVNLRRLKILELEYYDRKLPAKYYHGTGKLKEKRAFRGNAYKMGLVKTEYIQYRYKLFLPNSTMTDARFIKDFLV